MEKEEKIIAILLAMAILSLAVAYFIYMPGELGGNIEPLSDSTTLGEKVFVEGAVLNKRMTYSGDHLILEIEHEGEMITVFVPNNKGAKEIGKELAVNDMAHIAGVLDEYEGELEIIVKDKKDVEKL
ncbi:OB-fold nucleic acid binding domain-containing protein [Methanococcoides burtonii]|uniref:Nucleic acid binding protein n=1 Tax=Methanococcoides burtonii (strain DSM 6242 / NBRC 107633 / OCM 468 / ACE-M) TaxID=259564 RepID=Q12TW1_METBU|nr:OB-fold nucleic acid binding domain-containing protein [Methanococcoides burtonii]ABE53115.1 nucleic acid binding protein [Methanococcoides burtonii DSM 6242]